MKHSLPASTLYEALSDRGVAYFCGVPDSSLSAFGNYLEEHAGSTHNVAVNEGSAVALATGYHIATSKVPLVYMQNSGLGNAVNPLLSLADTAVMGIPMVLLIGWRGEPDTKDEPQHITQGRVTTDLLDTLEIPYVVLGRDSHQAVKQVDAIVRQCKTARRPCALLVPNGTFEPYTLERSEDSRRFMSRERAIQLVVDSLADQDIVVATTGKISRELYEYRDAKQQPHNRDLLIVGSMGHASAVAYGIAQQRPERKVFVLDGDGALLMHFGALPFIGSNKPQNLYHIVLNNGAHESVGGQPTIAQEIPLEALAKDSGYKRAYTVADEASVTRIVASLQTQTGPVFVDIHVASGSRSNLTRPNISPSENKASFMKFLGSS